MPHSDNNIWWKGSKYPSYIDTSSLSNKNFASYGNIGNVVTSKITQLLKMLKDILTVLDHESEAKVKSLFKENVYWDDTNTGKPLFAGVKLITPGYGTFYISDDGSVINDDVIGSVNLPNWLKTQLSNDLKRYQLEFLETNKTPSSSSSTSKETKVAVKKGDSLWGIGLEHGLTVDELLLLNPHIASRRNHLIMPGDKLVTDKSLLKKVQTKQTTSTLLKTPLTYRVKKGDTLSSISKKFGISINDLVAMNGIVDINHIYAGDVLTLKGDKYYHGRPKIQEVKQPSITLYSVPTADTIEIK